MSPPLQVFAADLGVSSEANKLTKEVFYAIRKLISQSDIPTNISYNLANAMAQTLLDNGLTTQESIALFFISRGSGNKMALTQQTADMLSKKISQLRFVADIQQFSIVGEGFTNQSVDNVNRYVNMPPGFEGMDGLPQTIRVILFQWIRTRPLYRKEGDKIVLQRRRPIRVMISDELQRRYQLTLNANNNLDDHNTFKNATKM